MRHVNGIDFHRSSSVQTTCGDKECIRGEHLEVRTKTEFKTLMPRAVKLSTQPILEWVEAHPAIEWAGGHHRELIKRKELTVFQVDAICIDSLKIHPAALYGDEFWKGIDDEVA
jgi:hypothetical protein